MLRWGRRAQERPAHSANQQLQEAQEKALGHRRERRSRECHGRHLVHLALPDVVEVVQLQAHTRTHECQHKVSGEMCLDCIARGEEGAPCPTEEACACTQGAEGLAHRVAQAHLAQVGHHQDGQHRNHLDGALKALALEGAGVGPPARQRTLTMSAGGARQRVGRTQAQTDRHHASLMH